MQPTSDSPLFQPYVLGELTLKNRIVMAPLTRSRSSDAGVPPDFAAEYYAQRATAGLIISEATNISPQARGYALTLGIWSPAQVDAWQHVTHAVHAQDGRMVLQLWHTGRISHPSLHDGALPVAPSAIKPTGQAFTNSGLQDHVTPRALEIDEIPAIVANYRHAAQCARDAGFDGVEVHSANNYLLEQFIRDSTNRRTDRYGGSLENRLRFPLEVVAAVTDVWGGGARVGIRISPDTTAPGGTPLDSDPMHTYTAYLDALSGFGLMYVHDIEGVTQMSRDANGIDYPGLRKRFTGAYVANNNYGRELAEQSLASGNADLISFGRPLIANPDLVDCLRTGAPPWPMRRSSIGMAETPRATPIGRGCRGSSSWRPDPTAALDAAAGYA